MSSDGHPSSHERTRHGFVPRSFRYGHSEIELLLPESTALFEPSFPTNPLPNDQIVRTAWEHPVAGAPLNERIRHRKPGDVVIVVSDITRPIPYHSFLPGLVDTLTTAGVARDEILLLVATGMHRPSRPDEHVTMFGADLARSLRIEDHRAEDDATLRETGKLSRSGNPITLNRSYCDAGFRIVTGLVEPHFMAGFSGGRKAICPGLASLDTVRNFHGFPFLSNPLALNANLQGNPLHEESLSVAQAVPPDFTINVVLDAARRLSAAFSGDLEPSHAAACDFVRTHACPPIAHPFDALITSSGGAPLDLTFYQCVKGFVSALPAVKPGGRIIAFGDASEGVGSPEYETVMRRFADDWRAFLADIQRPGVFTKDQWQFQMHARTLEKVGVENLLFFTHGIPSETLAQLSVNPRPATAQTVQQLIQREINALADSGASIAAFPEGPYCVPIATPFAS
jgi:nickel-dependent lactate racemase